MKPADIKKELSRQLAYWQETCNLQNWTITLRVRAKAPKHIKDYSALVQRNHETKEAFIYVYLNIFTISEMDEVIPHELTHLILADYDWYIANLCIHTSEKQLIKVRENVTTDIVKILLKLKREKRNGS